VVDAPSEERPGANRRAHTPVSALLVAEPAVPVERGAAGSGAEADAVGTRRAGGAADVLARLANGIGIRPTLGP
jgi:hypothetical protein